MTNTPTVDRVQPPAQRAPNDALRLELVAAPTHRYPGETVTFYIRATHARGYRLQVTLPEGLNLVGYEVPLVMVGRVPYTSKAEDFLEWSLEDDLTEWLIEITATLAPTAEPLMLASVAQLVSPDDMIEVETWASVHVEPKGAYLKYLPAFYEEDEFLGRFLMLFESFWKPITNQIGAMPYIFDPTMTPSRLLPWLGTWLDVTLDDALAETRQRRLIQKAVRLYRQRGTKMGLTALLELWTGAEISVVEHRSENLRLGKTMRLGQGIALGRKNAPFSFTVRVTVPAIDKEPPTVYQSRLDAMRLLVDQIVRAEKPAHTTYRLEIS